MIEYYDRLEEVDQELIEINEWQQREIERLYAETKAKIDKALAKLGSTMPETIKELNKNGNS